MDIVKKGDVVSRKSYNNDILFFVEDVSDGRDAEKFVILKGVTIRIEADAPIDDLELATLSDIDEKSFFLDDELNKRSIDGFRNCGKILHLDGDRGYSEKTTEYYKKRGLNSIVKHVAEFNQPYVVGKLIMEHNPDILVITGHDGMLKKGRYYNDINNYRNSRFFYRAVREARKLSPDKNDLIIFAGACQSYYEALISAGANFASSPARILIDFVDPLVVAQSIAVTSVNRIVLMSDLESKIRNGRKAIGGIGAKGKSL